MIVHSLIVATFVVFVLNVTASSVWSQLSLVVTVSSTRIRLYRLVLAWLMALCGVHNPRRTSRHHLTRMQRTTAGRFVSHTS